MDLARATDALLHEERSGHPLFDGKSDVTSVAIAGPISLQLNIVSRDATLSSESSSSTSQRMGSKTGRVEAGNGRHLLNSG